MRLILYERDFPRNSLYLKKFLKGNISSLFFFFLFIHFKLFIHIQIMHHKKNS